MAHIFLNLPHISIKNKNSLRYCTLSRYSFFLSQFFDLMNSRILIEWVITTCSAFQILVLFTKLLEISKLIRVRLKLSSLSSITGWFLLSLIIKNQWAVLELKSWGSILDLACGLFWSFLLSQWCSIQATYSFAMLLLWKP